MGTKLVGSTLLALTAMLAAGGVAGAARTPREVDVASHWNVNHDARPAPGHSSTTSRAEAAAQQALDRVRSLLHGPGDTTGASSTARSTPGATDATIALRDLADRVRDLPDRPRRAARRLLARPTDQSADPLGNGYRSPEKYTCSAHVCVHWVPKPGDADAPPLVDSDGDGVPDWVRTTDATFEHVWHRIVVVDGYRPPKNDEASANHGPDGRLDVYLAELGAHGLYGYCTSDDPEQRYDVSAYCVLDNDFARSQFGARPLDSLRVTTAHEFFHAVQFAYDWQEDTWLMEGTAAWMEDEVYDGVNDNLRFLDYSPLTRPGVSLDAMDYGTWVFWRYLSERFGPGRLADPTVVRQVWEAADAAPGGPDDYSVEAVRDVTKARHVSFRRLLAGFAEANRRARTWYQEGASYPRAPVSATTVLSPSRPATGVRTRTLNHLGSSHIRFVPGLALHGRWRLRVRLNLPDLTRGSVATVTVYRADGTVRTRLVPLDDAGDATTTAPFSPRGVSAVELGLTDAGTQYRCWRGSTLACRGTSSDDGLPFRYTAALAR